jgi:transposase
VPLGRARADEQLRANLRVREALGGESRDLRLLSGELVACVRCAPAQTARVRIARQQLKRIDALTREAEALKRELRDLIRTHRPELLAETGCGPLCAAILIGQTAGAERFASDAHFARVAGVAPIPLSSGRHDRHRLDRGGNRQLNRALHIIAITRGRIDPETRAYLARKEAEGKSRIEAMRCLKRHLARRYFRLLSERSRQPAHRAIARSCAAP